MDKITLTAAQGDEAQAKGLGLPTEFSFQDVVAWIEFFVNILKNLPPLPPKPTA